MKVKYVGFGGYLDEVPCYEDENGKLYFDLNDGKNGLRLATGAYRDEVGEIIGEPVSDVTETVECDKPFVRHPREFDYQMLGRYEDDCKYYLGYGNGYDKFLYYKDVDKQCDEMLKLYNSFSDADKPEWISTEKIENYRKEMHEKRDERIALKASKTKEIGTRCPKRRIR